MMSADMQSTDDVKKINVQTLHLFCRVVDNFGDIGVCWRLARQFAHEHGLQVTLWVDDLSSFQRICAAVQLVDHQDVDQVHIVHWQDDVVIQVMPEQVGDVVIEGFGCALPATYLAAMAQRQPPPVWINLEYLSAEAWIEECHAMQSVHPVLPLKKYFFFPGFTAKTGGVPLERDIWRQREAFHNDAKQQQEFLASLHIQRVSHTSLISLFRSN